MTKELNDKLENIAIHSAWTFDEAFQLLTGKTLFEVESLLSKSPPPSNDLKWVLMRKTKTIETRPGDSIHFKKGEIVPTSEDLLKRLVSEGSGKEVECPAAIKTEREEYRKAQDQSKLLENLKRAVLDSDIKSLNNTCQLPLPEWRLEGQSFLAWVHTKKETISQLRYFPSSVDDILMSKLLSSKSTRSTDKGFSPRFNSWSQVSFCLLVDGQFEIQVAGKNYSHDEIFGESPPKSIINFLRRISLKRGAFDNKSFDDISQESFRQNKARLNKLLKERFGLNEDPIPYNKVAGLYKSAFKCELQIDVDTDLEDYSPESNTPPGADVNHIRQLFKADQ
jgi:hypothetical protein